MILVIMLVLILPLIILHLLLPLLLLLLRIIIILLFLTLIILPHLPLLIILPLILLLVLVLFIIILPAPSSIHPFIQRHAALRNLPSCAVAVNCMSSAEDRRNHLGWRAPAVVKRLNRFAEDRA